MSANIQNAIHTQSPNDIEQITKLKESSHERTIRATKSCSQRHKTKWNKSAFEVTFKHTTVTSFAGILVSEFLVLNPRPDPECAPAPPRVQGRHDIEHRRRN